MRAIVTGGAGFIGSRLVARLLADRWSVTVVDDLSTHETPNRPFEYGRVQWVFGAVQKVGDQFPADAVFHLAGKVGPVGVLRWSGRIAPDTIDAAIVAHRWARGGPLIDVSTSEIYGFREDGRCAEDQARVIGPGHSARMEYAVAKLAAETMLLNRGGDVRIVRPFNVAGPGQRAEGGFVLPRFIAQAQRGEDLTVHQPGTQRRAFTHVDDIVDGLLAVLEHGKAGEAYNLGNPANECTIMRLAEEVIAATGSQSRIAIVDPATIHGPAFREAPDKIPDASKAMAELGWRPTRDRAMTIRDAIG